MIYVARVLQAVGWSLSVAALSPDLHVDLPEVMQGGNRSHSSEEICLLQRHAHVVRADVGLARVVSNAGDPPDPQELIGKVWSDTPAPSDDMPANAAEASGVTTNQAGDLEIFLSGLVANIGAMIGLWILFSILAKRMPILYQHNIEIENAPNLERARELVKTNFGWMRAAYCYSLEVRWVDKDDPTIEVGPTHPNRVPRLPEVAEKIGLDNTLLLRYIYVCLRMLAIIGIPMFFIIGPINCTYGGHPAWEQGDYLSSLSFGNVENGSWLYWVHAFAIWYVVIVVQTQIYKAQDEFLQLRYVWLRQMADMRAHTCLVEGIPDQYRSNEAVQQFFGNVFSPEDVIDAYVVKDTVVLAPLVDKLADAKINLANAEGKEKAKKEAEEAKAANATPQDVDGSEPQGASEQSAEAEAPQETPQPQPEEAAPEVTPTSQEPSTLDRQGTPEDDTAPQEGDGGFRSRLVRRMSSHATIFFDDFDTRHLPEVEFYQRKVKRLQKRIDKERARIKKIEGDINGVNRYTAFVTFRERKFAHLASNQQYTRDSEEWVVQVAPPEPADLRWNDLEQDPKSGAFFNVLGYICVIGLYFLYMPIVLSIGRVCLRIQAGPLENFWKALAPTMGLQIMVAFLPTMLLFIFRTFFTLKAEVWAQKQLQNSYFAFQFVFVVLVTAVGNSVPEFTEVLLADPLALPGVLADKMPSATHFYMNWLVVQWTTHVINLIRYMQLAKYRFWRMTLSPEEARKLAEPEDQDYYGIGSRSARFAITMIIGIVFGTLSPPINVLCFLNFVVASLVYGYLIAYAEQKKPDLGGPFWVDMLRHLFIGNIIYCFLMIGVLHSRAEIPPGQFEPAWIAGPSLIYVVWSFYRFHYAYTWHELPLTEIRDDDKIEKRVLTGKYVQPALYPWDDADDDVSKQGVNVDDTSSEHSSSVQSR